MSKPFVSLAIMAAGFGTRMAADKTKQKIVIAGKSVLRRSVEIFEKSDLVDEIIVALQASEIEFAKSELSSINKPLKLVIGGKTRAESAKNAFLAISEKSKYIAIHDAARCLTELSDAEAVIMDAIKYGAATASVRVTDTVKEIDEDGFIKHTYKRDLMRAVGTPQAFSVKLYGEAIRKTDIFDSDITDDNMLMEKIGVKVFCTETSKNNIKITTKSDLAYAEFLLKGESYE